jgi:hypothetical protein
LKIAKIAVRTGIRSLESFASIDVPADIRTFVLASGDVHATTRHEIERAFGRLPVSELRVI